MPLIGALGKDYPLSGCIKCDMRTNRTLAFGCHRPPCASIRNVRDIFHHVCKEHGITHKLTRPFHPWTNGQAERMNRTVKDAAIKAFHYPDLDSPKAHVLAFVSAYKFAKHLKAIRRKTPFKAICQAWTKPSHIFKLDPRHLIPGPNT